MLWPWVFEIVRGVCPVPLSDLPVAQRQVTGGSNLLPLAERQEAIREVPRREIEVGHCISNVPLSLQER